MKAMVAVIELDVSAYGTVQAEKILRIFNEFFRECTTFKGDMRGYIVYDIDGEAPNSLVAWSKYREVLTTETPGDMSANEATHSEVA